MIDAKNCPDEKMYSNCLHGKLAKAITKYLLLYKLQSTGSWESGKSFSFMIIIMNWGTVDVGLLG